MRTKGEMRAYTSLARRALEGHNRERRKSGSLVAIYHLSAKMLSRSAGRSAVAAAAYRSGGRLQDERTGRVYDFTRKGGVEHVEIVVPRRTPAWMLDRTELWNGVEKAEKRKDAQLAREIEVALPRELPAARRAGLVREFVQAEFVSRGMIADLAIHVGRARDGGEQPHAHIMLTTRIVTAEGFGPKNRDWNGTDKLDEWRARWAEHVNRDLERAGHRERIDHRSLDAQRAAAERDAAQARHAGDDRAAMAHDARAGALDREPEPKIGPIASQMERLGIRSRRGDERRAVEARNNRCQQLHKYARKLTREIAETARQLAGEARRRALDVARRLDSAYRAARTRTEAAIFPARAETADPISIIADAGAATRDALLGRARPTLTDRSSTADRDQLLGRVPNVHMTNAPARDDNERGR